jgi:hypothetical protein
MRLEMMVSILIYSYIEFLLCPLADCCLAILLAKNLHMSTSIQIVGLFVPLFLRNNTYYN